MATRARTTSRPSAADPAVVSPPSTSRARPRAKPQPKPRTRQQAKPAPRHRIDLALQGGGSHGAFTWGVLDALLEDGRFDIDGVCGTSAGAMNAAVLASGFAKGGAQGARDALRAFWADVAGAPGCFGHERDAGSAAPSKLAWPSWVFNRDQWPLYTLLEATLRLFSPYQLNPFNLNPLRDVLQRHVDIEALATGPLRVFVTATAVSTGQPRVFSGKDLSLDALLASACIPQVFQAVEIDGESYWDGGYSGNPALWPLIYETEAVDLLLVQINPLLRRGTPKTAIDIADRVNEITFNASLVAEMRAIAFVKRLLHEQRIDASRYKDLRLHRVHDEDGLAVFDASSKLNSDPRLLKQLFDLGRGAGQRWLAAHAADVGQRSSVALEQVFLAAR